MNQAQGHRTFKDYPHEKEDSTPIALKGNIAKMSFHRTTINRIFLSLQKFGPSFRGTSEEAKMENESPELNEEESIKREQFIDLFRNALLINFLPDGQDISLSYGIFPNLFSKVHSVHKWKDIERFIIRIIREPVSVSSFFLTDPLRGGWFKNITKLVLDLKNLTFDGKTVVSFYHMFRTIISLKKFSLFLWKDLHLGKSSIVFKLIIMELVRTHLQLEVFELYTNAKIPRLSTTMSSAYQYLVHLKTLALNTPIQDTPEKFYCFIECISKKLPKLQVLSLYYVTTEEFDLDWILKKLLTKPLLLKVYFTFFINSDHKRSSFLDTEESVHPAWNNWESILEWDRDGELEKISKNGKSGVWTKVSLRGKRQK